MKHKRILVIMIACSLWLLAACQNNDDQASEAFLHQASEALILPEETDRDITLTQTFSVLGENIVVTWASDTPDILNAQGVVYRPSFEVGNQVVILTATLSINDVSIQKNYTITVIARPQILQQWTIQFVTDGGTVMPNIQIESGATLTLPQHPSKTGFIFMGWFIDEARSISFNINQPIYNHTTLYAKWQAEVVQPTYSISFQTNGGDVLSSLFNIPEGEIIDVLPVPSRSGYQFSGWYIDETLHIPFVFGHLIQSNLTLYAKWEVDTAIVTYTITFLGAEPNQVDPMTMIESGSFITDLPEVSKQGYMFMGWFTDEARTLLFDIETPITSNLTLYAKFEAEEIIPEGTPISTALEFNQLSNSGAEGLYYLANDIDFQGHTWTYANYNFKGTINGNGKTLSHLTLHGTDRTGLFSRVNNFTLYDVTLRHFTISSTNRAGILIGETDGNNITLRNIRIIDSSVSGNSSNGVGALIGYTKPNNTVSIEQVIIEKTSVTNTSSAAGGLIGMSDSSSVMITDIQLKEVTVRASNRVGGIYGEIKGTVQIHIERVVMDIDLSTAQYLGGIIGRNQSASGVSVKHVLITGMMVSTSKDFGHLSGELAISQVEDVYVAALNTTGILNRQNVSSEHIISSLESLSLSWWENHLSAISTDAKWYYQNHLYHLIGLSFVPEDSMLVTLIIGFGQSEHLIYVKDNTQLSQPENPNHYGFEFIGWFKDADLTISFDFNQVITEPTTLYAKWAALPTYLVTIHGIEQMVVEGDQAIEVEPPVILGKIFVGWYVGEIPFDFSTPITSHVVITPKFEDATLYTLTFETLGGSLVSSVSFYENQSISQLPRPMLEGYRFVNWYLDIQLNQAMDLDYLNSDLTLYAKYAELGTIIFEESFTYSDGTSLSSTDWIASKPGLAIIESGTLKLTESATEAIYEQTLSVLADGRYVLVFDFKQGVGGASFTIELVHHTTRVFTVGANRSNRFTYRNSDGSETAVNLSIQSVIPNQYHQAIIVFDTEYDIYKYYVKQGENLIEITPSGGVGFASSLDPNKIRIRIVGHNNAPSSDPVTYLDNLLIESSSETVQGKSVFDPEAPIDYEQLVDSIYENLTIPFMQDVRSNLFLTHVVDHVPIIWQSSNLTVITHDGIVTRDENLDIEVTMTATISKGGFTQVKTFDVLVKAIQGTIDFSDDAYQVSGFASGHVSIPNLKEGDPGYYVVYNAKDLMDAINAENSASKGTTAARIIEIRNDLNLGYNDVVSEFGVLRNLDRHALPKMHPILKASGVSKIVIQDRDGSTAKYNEGLVIFSEGGYTIKHAAFQIKRAHNIVIRNLKFDELWEWDEATKGDYDSNDWDYFTVEQVNGIWFDHITLGKAYDGLIDFKAGTSTIQSVVNATMSYMHLVFEPNAFIQAQFEYLEANRASYNYYNQMRNAGMSMQEIMAVNSFQKKGFLLGGSELRAGNVFTLTIYNSYIKNLQDRFPRLRGGNVHIFNSIYDATDVYEMRNYVRANYATLFAKSEYNRQLTNQALVTTENGAILMENSIIMGVTQVIKSNQVSRDHPTMTGKYLVIDSLYVLDDYVFFGSSEDHGTPFMRSNAEPILPFSWNFITDLPYSNYTLVPVNILESYLSQAILGATDQAFEWLSLSGKPIHP